MKQPIGTFLLRRLQEVGIRHIFGVPGDYNLELMQQLEDRGEPAWNASWTNTMRQSI
jgi:indolepyruvate decarboxylase